MQGGAAAQGGISGIVADSASGEALARASVAVRSARDSSLVTGAITDNDGNFTISGIRPGRYYARVSFVGYVTLTVPDIVVASSVVDLGTVRISQDRQLGAEVTVTARREFMTLAIDRTIYKTADLAVATGGTTLDILRNIPTIEVDASDNISLKGSQNVVVQINGRPSMVTGTMLSTFLRGLPADAIERVEVIPNPSAKYDPDGMSGIINIVMKQNAERGFSGGINGSIGTHSSYSLAGNLSYRAGPWNLFGNYGFNYNNRSHTGSYTRRNLIPGPVPYLEGSSSEDDLAPSHLVNVNVDFAASKEHTTSLSATVNLRSSDETGMNQYIERDTALAVISRYERSTASDGSNQGLDLRLGHKWTIEPARHELAAEVRYADNDRSEDSRYANQDLAADGSPIGGPLDRQNTSEPSGNRSMVLQADYSRPFGPSGRMETGYKGEMERIRSDFSSESFDATSGTFVPDSALNNSFVYDREIHAVYALYGHDFGTLSAQAGLRLEQALTRFDLTTTSQQFRNDYFSAFPSAFVIYKPQDELQLKASFSRRISRPSTQTLNPFPGLNDPNFRRAGNPGLRPEYTNAYELSGSYFGDGTSVTMTGFYRRTTDLMRRYAFTDSSGVTTMTWTNFATNENFGADITATLRAGDWFNGFLFASGYQSVTDASNVDTTFNMSGLQWTFRANATFTVMKGLDIQASYMYRPASQTEGARMSDMQMLDITVQQNLFDDKGRIGLRINDPFNAQRFSMTRNDPTAEISFTRKRTSRIVALTFSYAFGSGDASRRRQPTNQGGGSGMMDME